MKKLNIGCGEKIIEGYDGLDKQSFGQKWVCDILEFFTEFNLENLYDEVRAEHFLEHFDQNELKIIFNGVHKILKTGGMFEIIVPSKEKDSAWVLTHKTFWTEDTFKVFENKIFSGEFNGGKWKIKEIKTNSRKDIYCEMIKL